MKPTETERNDPRTDAEERFRRWASRPPETVPGEAARQVVARLAETSGRRWSLHLGPRLQWAAAVVMVAVLSVAGWLATSRTSPGPDGLVGAVGAVGATQDLLPLEDGVVLLWLDSETPLYMTLTPPQPAAKKGDAS